MSEPNIEAGVWILTLGVISTTTIDLGHRLMVVIITCIIV